MSKANCTLWHDILLLTSFGLLVGFKWSLWIHKYYHESSYILWILCVYKTSLYVKNIVICVVLSGPISNLDASIFSQLTCWVRFIFPYYERGNSIWNTFFLLFYYLSYFLSSHIFPNHFIHGCRFWKAFHINDVFTLKTVLHEKTQLPANLFSICEFPALDNDSRMRCEDIYAKRKTIETRCTIQTLPVGCRAKLF